MNCSFLATALTQGVRGESQAYTSIALSVAMIGYIFHSLLFLYFFEIRTIKFLFTTWLPNKGYDGRQLWKKIEVNPFTMSEKSPVWYLSYYFSSVNSGRNS